MDYHKKPTYAEIVKSTITNPKDKIDLPDRYATRLRNTPQMTRYDDESFLELTKDNQNIMVEQMKQTTVRQQAAASQTTTHTVERATGDDEVDAPMPQAPPQPPPSPAAAPKISTGGARHLPPKLKPTTFDEPMLPAHHAPSPTPPPAPGAAPTAVTFDPNMSAHLEREFSYANAHIKHIASNMQTVKDGVLAGMKQHMGHTFNLITQVMTPPSKSLIIIIRARRKRLHGPDHGRRSATETTTRRRRS